MKILLIDPKRINLETYLILPNLGIGYNASALRRAGHDVKICNAARKNMLPEDVARTVAEERYNLVGITIFTPYFSSAGMYAEALRRRVPETILVAGGPHAIFEPEEIYERIPAFDYVVTGEGEETFPALVSLLESREEPGPADLEKIPNLCFRDGNGFRKTERSLIKDIKPLDPVAWDLLGPHKFGLHPNGIFTKKKKVAPMITSRGCPYPCKFCGAGLAMGRKIRHRDPESILDDMQLLRDEYDIWEIQMMDDNFIVDNRFAIDVCEGMIRRKLDMVWGCPPGIRVDCVTEEVISAMAAAGCYSTSLGIESGSQRVLNLMKKKIDLDEVPRKLSIIRKHGIRVTGLFILGFPGETTGEMEQTVALSLKLDLNRANFFTFTPFPGSVMYDELKAMGKLDNLNYDDLYIHNLGYVDDSIDPDALDQVHKRAHFRFYLRPRIILGILKEIHSLSQVQIILKRAMKVIFSKKKNRKC